MSERKPTSRRSPQPVKAVLDSRAGQIGKLVSQARAMAKLENQLTGLLDSGMSGLVRVATVRDGCLVLVTPSAALASRLRMDHESIISSLNAAAGLKLKSLRVRTAPIPQARPEQRKRRSLPSAAREVLSRFKE